jgi:hypothetical protein
MIPHATIPRDAPNYGVAALVLKMDTIPKPDGLGMSSRFELFERIVNIFEHRSRIFDTCATVVRAQNLPVSGESRNLSSFVVLSRGALNDLAVLRSASRVEINGSALG